MYIIPNIYQILSHFFDTKNKLVVIRAYFLS